VVIHKVSEEHYRQIGKVGISIDQVNEVDRELIDCSFRSLLFLVHNLRILCPPRPSPRKVDRISARSGVGFFVGSGWTGLGWIVVWFDRIYPSRANPKGTFTSVHAKIEVFGTAS
jgi:hypothetical protein